MARTLADLAAALGDDRQIAIGWELTKMHEEVWRGSLADAVTRVAEVEPRGEHVIVIDGAPPLAAASDADLASAVARLIPDGLSTRDAVAEVASAFDVSKRRVYDLAVSRAVRTGRR